MSDDLTQDERFATAQALDMHIWQLRLKRKRRALWDSPRSSSTARRRKVTTDIYGHWEAAERKKQAGMLEGAFGV